MLSGVHERNEVIIFIVFVIFTMLIEKARNGYVCALLSIASCQLQRRTGCRCGCEDHTDNNFMCLLYEYPH